MHLVAATVGVPVAVEGSICRVSLDPETTTWSAWLVTPTALAVVSQTFDVADFDLSRAEDNYYRTHPPAETIHAAASYRLSDISALHVAGVNERGDSMRPWLSLRGLRVELASSDTAVNLPPQDAERTRDEREASDAFYEALRRGAEL